MKKFQHRCGLILARSFAWDAPTRFVKKFKRLQPHRGNENHLTNSNRIIIEMVKPIKENKTRQTRGKYFQYDLCMCDLIFMIFGWYFIFKIQCVVYDFYFWILCSSHQVNQLVCYGASTNYSHNFINCTTAMKMPWCLFLANACLCLIAARWFFILLLIYLL